MPGAKFFSLKSTRRYRARCGPARTTVTPAGDRNKSANGADGTNRRGRCASTTESPSLREASRSSGCAALSWGATTMELLNSVVAELAGR